MHSDMSGCINVIASEQLTFIPCNFCNIVLEVKVPGNRSLDMVTVRCGHCGNLWSADMAAALQSSLSWKNSQTQKFISPNDNVDTSSSSKRSIISMATLTSNKDEYTLDRPPQKRQRLPSAYNRFIKEEIKRIKAAKPDVTHREAFSAAAKNWAHFPHIHFGLTLENKSQTALDEGSEKLLPTNAGTCLSEL